MNKKESSVLLYLETRLVDHAGRVRDDQLNADDMKIIDRWKSIGFIRFGRIVARDVNPGGSLWVDFSSEAWEIAHAERKKRAERTQKNRGYQTTEEKRQQTDD